MRSLILSIVTAVAVLVSTPAAAERMWDAVQTYRLGYFVQARLAFAELAAQGEPQAFFWLGKLMQRGHGGPADMDKAFRSYQAGAYLGDVHSMNSLGQLYRDSRHGFTDRSMALAWFSIGAKTGNRTAIRNARDLDLFSPPATREEADIQQRRLEAEMEETLALFATALGPNRLTDLPVLSEAMKVLHREFQTR